MNETARERAAAFVVFCNGLEQGGLVDYARLGRVVAHDCLEALDRLDGARGALRAMTRDRDRWRDDKWREAHGTGWPK